MADRVAKPNLDLHQLCCAIQEEYTEVALHPDRGFHFQTGRPLATLLGYREEWLEGVPLSSVASFAGTGNPFVSGELRSGERVVDVGSGAGLDCFIASRMVAPRGQVIGVDMTPAMVAKARVAMAKAHISNVEFREGRGEALPVEDEWADVVISNGALNLMPDKLRALREMARVLQPNGRLQIGDILVRKEVPSHAKEDITLWTG